MISIYRKSFFDMPKNIIYLDGNSLGPLLKGITEESERVINKEWGEKLIKGWNESHWMDQPVRVGNKLARILKAEDGSIILGETLSLKLYQALGAALDLNNERKVILTDSGNFPSDLYIAKGLIDTLNRNLELKIVKPEEVESLAVLDSKPSQETAKKRQRSLQKIKRFLWVLTLWIPVHFIMILPDALRLPKGVSQSISCCLP